MATSDLKQKAAAGMAWTAVQKYSTMIIQFISGIILARLLTPHDYGCIGMLSIFMALAETFIDGGFGSALIQKKNPTQQDYSTIFFWNLGMSAILYAVLFFSAPAIARFYDISLLCPVLRVQALVLFIYAFNLVQRNQLRKKLNFKLLSIITVTTSLISLGVTIFMAYKGFGVWALVAQNLISAAIPAIVFWFYVRWRPIWTFSWKSFKELFSFGGFMFLTQLLNTFANRIGGLLIGKKYNSVTMGYYSKAMNTENLASQTISSIMNQVTYPLYAQVQDDKETMVNMIKRLSVTISYITVPLMFILLLTARPIFVLLYSDKWLPSVPYFQVICLAGLASCIGGVNTQPIAAIGKSRIMFRWTVIKRTVGISIVILAMSLWGMKGLLGAVVFTNWFSLWVNQGLVSKYIGYGFVRQWLDLLPVYLVATIAGLASWGVGYLFCLDMYLDGILKLCVFLMVFLGWSLIFKPEAYTYTLSIIPDKFKLGGKKHNC